MLDDHVSSSWDTLDHKSFGMLDGCAGSTVLLGTPWNEVNRGREESPRSRVTPPQHAKSARAGDPGDRRHRRHREPENPFCRELTRVSLNRTGAYIPGNFMPASFLPKLALPMSL